MATSSILEKHMTAPFLLQKIILNEASDIFSLGEILFKVGVKQNIPLLVSMAQECLDASPVRRPTTTGIMATLASIISH